MVKMLLKNTSYLDSITKQGKVVVSNKFEASQKVSNYLLSPVLRILLVDPDKVNFLCIPLVILLSETRRPV